MNRHSTVVSGIVTCCVLLISACTSSLVYSPSVALPRKPLEKKEWQLSGGLDLLAETRPASFGRNTIIGAGGLVRYGISDYVSIHGKGWTDILSDAAGTGRGGVTAGLHVKLQDPNADWRLALAPSATILIDNSSFYGSWRIEGGGGAFTLTTWFPANGIFRPYAVIGPMIGVRDLQDNEWGYGLIANLGSNFDLSDHFSINAELAGIIQRNQFDRITHGIIAPSIGLSVYFDAK